MQLNCESDLTPRLKQAFKWQPTLAIKSNAIEVEEQYENHATFKCSLCNCKDLRARQKGWSEPPLTNRGRPKQLTKTESGIQGTKVRGKGIHCSWYWTTHNCHTQRNCFLCSYNPTNLIAIQTIAIQSQHGWAGDYRTRRATIQLASHWQQACQS